MKIQHSQQITSREAAYKTLLEHHKSGLFIDVILEDYKPFLSDRDFKLAYELCCGTLRMKKRLEHIAVHDLKLSKLPEKAKEKYLLYLALYQYFFLDKIPIYALSFETVNLAKKYCHSFFVKFINHTLRNLKDVPVTKEPSSATLGNIASYYSYTEFFVEALQETYGTQTTNIILQNMNLPVPLMARKRAPRNTLKSDTEYTPEMILDASQIMSSLKDCTSYIQNITQAKLLCELKKTLSTTPHTILDLCAAPGGKTILLHDLFPHAQIHANDSSQSRIQVLTENLNRYQIAAHVTCEDALKMSSQHTYDLILIDAPCSNSGVLYKCPEARWRITKEAMIEITEIQKMLLKKATELVSQEGTIWYTTCSILPQENNSIIHFAETHLGLQKLHEGTLILPLDSFHEGGFAQAFKKK